MLREGVSLFLVPTPVGNLEDITLRGINTLKSADIILAEDTRKTGRLLKHYEISIPMVSYHAFNEHKITEQLISRMAEGERFALVTDAGTPGISDPGYLLVNACLRNNITVEALPGATAFVPALVKSGLATDRFVFEGFLPQKKGRTKRMKALTEEDRTMIFYESPHRLVKTLTLFCDYFEKERQVSVSKEISKLYEKTVNGSLSDLIEHFSTKNVKGEYVIVVEGRKQ